MDTKDSAYWHDKDDPLALRHGKEKWEEARQMLFARHYLNWLAHSHPTEAEINAVRKDCNDWLDGAISKSAASSAQFLRDVGNAIAMENEAIAFKNASTPPIVKSYFDCTAGCGGTAGGDHDYWSSFDWSAPFEAAYKGYIATGTGIINTPSVEQQKNDRMRRRLDELEISAMIMPQPVWGMNAGSTVAPKEQFFEDQPCPPNSIGYIASNPNRKPEPAGYVEDVPKDSDSIMDAVRAMSK